MRQSIRRPSAALVVACLALLVALGGTSYATVLQVPRNSVGPLQLKRNAVGPSKVAPNAIRSGHVLNGSLLTEDFKAGQIPQGPKGDKGEKGDKGDRGPMGPAGASGYQVVRTSRTSTFGASTFTATCPSGKSPLGGGASSSSIGISGPFMVESGPSGNGWFVRYLNTTPLTATITAYVVCARFT